MKRKMKFHYSNETETKEFEITVKLSVECQLYFSQKDIPEELLVFRGISEKDRKYFDDYSELKASVSEIIDDYEASFIEESIEKIIVYFVYSNEPYHCKSCELSLGFQVLEKVTIGNESHYQERKKYRGGIIVEKIHSPFSSYDLRDQHIKEMIWTEQRENWFKSIVVNMKKLTANVNQGLNRRSTLLAKQIDNNVVNLLSEGNIK